MGERFVDQYPLVSLPKISRENTCVENDLVCIVDNFLGGVWCVAGVCVRNCVVDLPPDDLDGVSGSICLVEALIIHNPVGVGDDGVGLVDVGEQI